MKITPLVTIALLLATSVAVAQAPLQVVVPAGTPQGPVGFASLGGPATIVWFGDAAGGLVGYTPDPSNPGRFVSQAGNTIYSVGGPASSCLPFCVANGIAQVNDSIAFVASADPQKPQVGFVRGAGIYMLQFSGLAPPASPIGQFTNLTITKGIAGDQPDAVAFGPDGKLYFGGLGNPNLRRVTNPTAADLTTQQVETFGGNLNGQPTFAMTFNGSNLYVASPNGLTVVPNAPACFGNANNCGRPALIVGGSTLALASDGFGHVYFATALGVVDRYDVATGVVAQVTSGLSFGGNRAGLGIDRQGNLWIGQSSEIDRVLAADLAAIQ